MKDRGERKYDNHLKRARVNIDGRRKRLVFLLNLCIMYRDDITGIGHWSLVTKGRDPGHRVCMGHGVYTHYNQPQRRGGEQC